MSAKWIDSSQQEYTAILKISGLDHLGLVNEITNVISSNLHVNMKSLSFESNHGLFSGKVTVQVNSNSLVKKLMERIKKINGIEKVQRL